MIRANKKIKVYLIPLLITLSFLSRFITAYFFKDVDLYSVNVNEWNILLHNLTEYKSYSLYTFNNEFIPSVFMPPIYPIFLYLVKVITSLEGVNLLYTIIFVLGSYNAFV